MEVAVSAVPRTTTLRLKSILEENRLRRAPMGVKAVSLTVSKKVAEYFACNSLFGDRHDRPALESAPVVLVLNGELMLAEEYELEYESDDCWGEGECDWENEIACWDDISPLSNVLLGVENVSADAYARYEESGRASFKPSGPRLADVMLCIMEGVVPGFWYGSLTEHEADQFAALVQRVRARTDLM
jgi:hypothetical protein